MGKPIVHEEPDSPRSEGCSPQSSGTATDGGDVQYGSFKTVQGADWSVSMRQSKRGFHCHALVQARLCLPPDQAFEMLIDPVMKPWRHVKVGDQHAPRGYERLDLAWSPRMFPAG